MKNIISLAAVALCGLHSNAAVVSKTHKPKLLKICAGFLPENTMNIPEQGPGVTVTGITQTQFNQVLDRIQTEYAPTIRQKGASFSIVRNWSDGTVNAFADRFGWSWKIHMFGGMARFPSMTADGFMAVACHEVGHHLGGAPLYTGDNWAAVEGAADYYATLKCLKRIFEHDDNEKILNGRKLDATAVAQCTSEASSKQDRLLCIRATMAGVSLATVLASLDKSGVPRISTPDRHVVSRTYEAHPAAQCRLDTYFQGSLCRVNFNSDMSNSDYHIGSCADSRTYARGLRPRCWFKP